jgi:hypothetical protein
VYVYHVVGGYGKVCDESGLTSIEKGARHPFQTAKAHQIIKDSDNDLIVYVVADNPISESVYLPTNQRLV